MNIIIPYIAWNVIVCLIYGIDKYKAKANAWRIPEKTLMLCAVFMGGVGAYAGMQMFRHKTRHTTFKIIIPALAIINLAIIAALGLAPEKLSEFFRF